jgi:lipopolysaccharide transport system ATP-binding protein
MYLEKGKLRAYEPIEACVSRYIRSSPVAGLSWEGNVGDDHMRITRCVLQPPSTNIGFFYHGEKTRLDVEFEILEPSADLILGFSVLNSFHHSVARSRLCDHLEYRSIVMAVGKHQISFEIDLDFFHPGEYQIRLDCSLLNTKQILHEEVLLKFAVYSPDKHLKVERGIEREGISLGNKWVAYTGTEQPTIRSF